MGACEDLSPFPGSHPSHFKLRAAPGAIFLSAFQAGSPHSETLWAAVALKGRTPAEAFEAGIIPIHRDPLTTGFYSKSGKLNKVLGGLVYREDPISASKKIAVSLNPVLKPLAKQGIIDFFRVACGSLSNLEQWNKPMQKQLTALIEREGDGFVSLCPELDIASQGDTIEEARENLREALELFFETASPEEIRMRLHEEVYVTRVEIAVG